MSNSTPTVAVLGGGFAGLKAALILDRQLQPHEARVVLVDQSPYHTLRPKLPQAVGGRIACAVHVPFAEITAGKNIRFVQDAITALDPTGPRVELEQGELQADYLLIALGGESLAPSPELMPAWTFGQACAIRMALGAQAEAARAGETVDTNVIVVGGGFVGVEVAAEIQHKLQRTGAVARGAGTILIEAEDRLLPRLPAQAGELARQRLEQLGVQIKTSVTVDGAEPGRVMLADGGSVAAGTLIWAGGVGPAGPVARSPLADSTGMAPVDEFLRSVDQPRVYVAGDCGYVVGDHANSETRTYEPSAHRAEAQAAVAAANILADLKGGTPTAYRPGPHKYLLGLGPGYGILAKGSGSVRGGLMPSLIKEVVMLKHLREIGGSALVRKTMHPVTGMALRSKHWDGPPLHEGNVCCR